MRIIAVLRAVSSCIALAYFVCCIACRIRVRISPRISARVLRRVLLCVLNAYRSVYRVRRITNVLSLVSAFVSDAYVRASAVQAQIEEHAQAVKGAGSTGRVFALVFPAYYRRIRVIHTGPAQYALNTSI